VLLPHLKEITNNLYDSAKDFNTQTLPAIKELEKEHGIVFDLSIMASIPLQQKWYIDITTDIKKLKEFYSEEREDTLGFVKWFIENKGGKELENFETPVMFDSRMQYMLKPFLLHFLQANPLPHNKKIGLITHAMVSHFTGSKKGFRGNYYKEFLPLTNCEVFPWHLE